MLGVVHHGAGSEVRHAHHVVLEARRRPASRHRRACCDPLAPVQRAFTVHDPPHRGAVFADHVVSLVAFLAGAWSTGCHRYMWHGAQPASRGSRDRAVLLAHGAGSDMHGAALVAVADALAAAGVASLRFELPLPQRREEGTRPSGGARRRPPGRPRPSPRAGQTPARAAGARRPVDGRPLLLDGGRRAPTIPSRRWGCCSSATRSTRAGKPDPPRVEHFPRLRVPVLFVSGTRDALASRPHSPPPQEGQGPGDSTGSTPPTTATGR